MDLALALPCRTVLPTQAEWQRQRARLLPLLLATEFVAGLVYALLR